MQACIGVELVTSVTYFLLDFLECTMAEQFLPVVSYFDNLTG